MSPFEDFEIPDSLYERALMLQNVVMSHVTGGQGEFDLYRELRANFMRENLGDLLPEFIRTCHDLNHIWAYFKPIASDQGIWAARREHIWEKFRPLLDHLEKSNANPTHDAISETLGAFDQENIQSTWKKALDRCDKDPEGAITAARTLLEGTCKYILDENNIDYDNDNLPTLYKKTAETLNLSPSQHTEKAFKAILSGCHTIVQNFSEIRNKLGDAHGQGKKQVRPAPRHALLVVNLAGTTASFLLETWDNNKNQPK